MGWPHEGKDSRNLNLLEKFLNSNHMLLLYEKDGRSYRTMVLLSSFKKEYQLVLATQLSPSATQPEIVALQTLPLHFCGPTPDSGRHTGISKVQRGGPGRASHGSDKHFRFHSAIFFQ